MARILHVIGLTMQLSIEFTFHKDITPKIIIDWRRFFNLPETLLMLTLDIKFITIFRKICFRALTLQFLIKYIFPWGIVL